MASTEQKIGSDKMEQRMSVIHEAAKTNDAVAEARELAAKKIKREINTFAEKYTNYLPDLLVVGTKKPTGGRASIEAHDSVVYYDKSAGDLSRYFYNITPHIAINQETGENYVAPHPNRPDEKPEILTTHPTNSDYWLEYGHRTVREMARVVDHKISQ